MTSRTSFRFLVLGALIKQKLVPWVTWGGWYQLVWHPSRITNVLIHILSLLFPSSSPMPPATTPTCAKWCSSTWSPSCGPSSGASSCASAPSSASQLSRGRPPWLRRPRKGSGCRVWAAWWGRREIRWDGRWTTWERDFLFSRVGADYKRGYRVGTQGDEGCSLPLSQFKTPHEKSPPCPFSLLCLGDEQHCDSTLCWL